MSTPTRPIPKVASSCRLKIVARRFWPYSGAPEIGIGELAEALSRAGHQVELVTIGWNRSWPRYFRYRSFHVCRLNRPTGGPWGSYRYLKSLTRYLAADLPDGLIVCGLGEEALAIQKSIGADVPCWIRLDEFTAWPGEGADRLGSRQLQTLAAAERVLVESEPTADRLRELPGVDPERVLVAADGVEMNAYQPREINRQNLARRAYSHAHPMLEVSTGQPLAISAAPLEGDPGWLDLVEAWSMLCREWPQAKLWIVGDGTRSRMVWDAVVKWQLAAKIVMPGEMDDLEDLFQAADLYLHPLHGDRLSSNLLRAQAAGLVAVATSGVAATIGLHDQVNAIVVPPRQPGTLAAVTRAVLGNRAMRDRLGQAARQVAARYDLDQRLRHFLPARV